MKHATFLAPQVVRLLRQASGIRDRKHFRTALLAPLVTAGWLELTIPDKPRSSNQKYRMTAAGRAVLEKVDA